MKLSFTLALLLPLAAAAQVPTLTTVVPARHATIAPRTGALTFNFSQAVTGAAGLRVQGSMSRGRRAGTTAGDGTTSLSFRPQQAFAPGEAVQITIPATVRGAATGGQPLAAGQVVQFRAQAGPATGTFGGTGSLSGYVGSYYDPTLADFNNDGKLDMAMAASPGAGFGLYLGNGQGGFSTTAPVAGPESNYLQCGDFNEDGNLDVALATYSNLDVLLGDGLGQFQAQPTVRFNPTASTTMTGLQMGDFNGDGHLDLVYILGTFSQGRIVVEMRLGNGQGQFTATPATGVSLAFSSLPVPYGLHCGDVNNDGALDLLISDYGAQSLKAYLGTGSGSFGAVPITSPGTLSTTSTPPVDLNGDGNLDLLVGNTLRLGTGTGSFGPSVVLPLPATFFAAGNSYAADIDGDGDLDVVASVSSSSTSPGDRLVSWRNDGSGIFGAATTTTVAGSLLAFGDLNNDGTLDLVDANSRSNEVNIRLNQALATAPTITSLTPTTGNPGTVVTLTGTNFTGATTVLVGGVPVTGFTVVNGTTITFTIPAGTPAGLVTVLAPTGQGTSATAFTTILASHPAHGSAAISLYPNPAHGTTTLLISAGTGAGPVELALYNSLGQLVRRLPSANLSATGLRTELDLSGISAGLYTLRLAVGGAAITRKLAVR